MTTTLAETSGPWLGLLLHVEIIKDKSDRSHQRATGSVLSGPINKLVLLLESPEDRPGITDEKPKDHL